MPSGVFTLKQQELALGQGAWTAAPNYAGTFNGSTQYIVTPSSSNLSMGTGDFTIECWCFPNAQELRGLFQTSPSAGLPGVQSGIGVYFTTTVGAWNVYLAGTSYTPTGLTLANQWTHIAITRSGTTSRFFVNGVLAQTVAGDTTNYTDTYFVIGGFLSTAYLWRGQISNFRVIKGTALYTAAFTPPQNALTAVSGTQLLTLQNPTIVDNSANNFSLTNTGTVTTSLQYPFSTIKPLAVDYLVVAGGGAGGGFYGAGGGAGGLLQGSLPVATGSALTVTVGGGGTGGSNAAGTNGSNSVFSSITATGGGFGPAGQAAGGSGGSGGGSGGNPPGRWGQGVGGQGNRGGDAGSGTGPAPGGGGGAGTRGLDGYGEGPAGNGGAGAASDISGTRTTYAGGGGGGTYLRGSSGLQGSGGAGGGGAGGDSNGNNNGFAGTVSTGGGGGGGSTGGGASSGGNGGSGIVIISYPDTYAAPASTTGSPTVSTSGSGSVLLNGTTNELNYGSSSAFAFGTGAYTVEFFVYLNTAVSASHQPCFVFNDTTNGWGMYNQNGSFQLQIGARASGPVVSSSTTLSPGAWIHVVAVRSGTGSNQTSIFVNGSRVANGTDNTNWTVTGPLKVGGISFTGYYVDGYMSNVRIVKGTAVYDPTASTITQPTAPLTAITNTQLLLNTVSGSYLTDSSPNGFPPTSATVAGTWNQLSPFVTGLGYKNRVYTWTSSGSITF